MPLETAPFLSDLNIANPAHTDGLNQADSHLRLIKSALKATFPNFTSAALTSTQVQIDGAVLGTAPGRFPVGTALLPGLTAVGDPDTGLFSPGPDSFALSVGGLQQALFTNGAALFVGGVACSAVVSVGAYSGGTGQLVPIGAVLEWYDTTLPAEGGYCWANGQIIANANTVCPILLARWGNRFGGNGTTTMGVPDRRQTVGIGIDTMGGTTTRGLGGNVSTTTPGAVIGEAFHVLTTAEMPSHFHSASISDPGHTHSSNAATIVGSAVAGAANFAVAALTNTATITASNTGVRVTSLNGIDQTNSTGGGAGHSIVQPSTGAGYILRLG